MELALNSLRTLALNMMSLAQEKFLTPDWIQQFIRHISSAPVLMVDANLSPPALAASCKSNFIVSVLLLSICTLFIALSFF